MRIRARLHESGQCSRAIHTYTTSFKRGSVGPKVPVKSVIIACYYNNSNKNAERESGK